MSFFDRLKEAVAPEWRAYTHHPFTAAMADGSLPERAFRRYLVQDYLFLIEFARAYALAVYKAPRLADMRHSAATMQAILNEEMDLHIRLCAAWGLSAEDLETAEPASEMLAYTRYVLEAGLRGDLLTLKVALAPCLIGYAEIALHLAATDRPVDPANRYRAWIAEYAGASYQALAATARVQLDQLAERYLTPARDGELIGVFRHATRLETDFWEMGWRERHGLSENGRL